MDEVTRDSPGPAPVRVVVVDDERLVREGLLLLLGGDPGIEVVGQAEDGLAAEAVIARTRPDVVLMDIRMPRCNGLDATARELRRRPDLAVLVLTTFDADEMVLGALRSGARGFVLKDTPPAELVAAVHAAAEGRSTLSPSVLDRVIEVAAGRGGGAGPGAGQGVGPVAGTGVDAAVVVGEVERFERLTEREAEVARAVARGLTNAQVAADLFITLATVKTHVGHVYEKLEVEGRVDLAMLVHRVGGAR
ncbi:LuxR family transcriptional regulator [Frigoribacterium sp. Leaf164]|uniref:response regulator transcription factor n=1 Tax=Frigoribacterium sp. Leaf164 TaxID=1736282 RepID=UPI0006F5BDCA|nr:response regulator transcription factor [Frigoribacterium sp. Leaf164]KQR44011.1 LuxR family transcriptional regulator [Frigoribacterium sp. Leaf164]